MNIHRNIMERVEKAKYCVNDIQGAEVYYIFCILHMLLLTHPMLNIKFDDMAFELKNRKYYSNEQYLLIIQVL